MCKTGFTFKRNPHDDPKVEWIVTAYPADDPEMPANAVQLALQPQSELVIEEPNGDLTTFVVFLEKWPGDLLYVSTRINMIEPGRLHCFSWADEIKKRRKFKPRVYELPRRSTKAD